MRSLTFALLATCLAATPGLASEWRYCYAASSAQHRFYASQPFEARASMDKIEQNFRAMLEQRQIEQDSVGCPLGTDKQDIIDQIQKAESYNTRNGNTIVILGQPGDEALAW